MYRGHDNAAAVWVPRCGRYQLLQFSSLLFVHHLLENSFINSIALYRFN